MVFFMRLSTERTPEANNKFGGAGVHTNYHYQFSCAKHNGGLMLSKWICNVLHLDQGNARHKYRQGREWVENSPGSSRRAGNELRQPRKSKMSWSRKSSVGSRLREMILHFHSGETLSAVLHLALAHYRGMETCWSREGCEDDLRLKHLGYGDRLRELGLFSLENRRFWGDLRVPSSL